MKKKNWKKNIFFLNLIVFWISNRFQISFHFGFPVSSVEIWTSHFLFSSQFFCGVLHMWHFFVWLECPTSFVPQTSCHYQMVGSTRSRETQVAQRSCQVNRWGGHKRNMRNQQQLQRPCLLMGSTLGHGKPYRCLLPIPEKTSVGCFMSHQVFPESKNRMWLMQLPHEVVQCQKTSGRRFEPYK